MVGRGLTVKVSHFASDMDVYASDYYRLDGKTPFPVRWMAWESIFLVRERERKIDNTTFLFMLSEKSTHTCVYVYGRWDVNKAISI